jgi:hypothetical protein
MTAIARTSQRPEQDEHGPCQDPIQLHVGRGVDAGDPSTDLIRLGLVFVSDGLSLRPPRVQLVQKSMFLLDKLLNMGKYWLVCGG